MSDYFGSQAIVGAIDVRKNFLKGYRTYINSGSQKLSYNPIEWAMNLEMQGVGELLLTSIDNEGSWSGYDIELLKKVSSVVTVPVIANGGAGKLEDLSDAVVIGGASAVAIGSMVVYQKKDMGVLINFPDKNKLKEIL